MQMMHMQQTLKSLCLKTGWCYAVFWKLKRRSRMMLTWEDGYYDYSKSSANSCTSHVYSSLETGGNPLDQGGSGDREGQIGLAVAKMSYYVYSMGEGIIGRVAFTGKHQWVLHDEENRMEAAPGSILNNQSMLEKYPDGWQNQFAAGIKTIAIIAVPQGVVQLGSTQLITEDLKWIDHIKSVFGALQTVPLALRSDLLSEGQGERLAYSMPFMSAASTSTAVRRPITLQQSQCSSRNAEDILQWHKYDLQASPKVPSNMKGLQPMSGTAFVAGAMPQELQHQQVVKMLAEAQRSKHASTHPGPQSSQMRATVPHFDLPSNCNQKILLGDEMRTCDLKDTEEKQPRENEVEQCTESLLMGMMAGGVSTGLHKEFKVNGGLSTCLLGQVAEDLSSNQEDICLNKRFVMYRMSDTKNDQGCLGISSSYGVGQQQQVDTETPLHMPAYNVGATYVLKQHLPSLNHSSSSRSFLKCDVADKHCNSSSVKDKMANQECSNDVSQMVGASCRLPAKQSTSSSHAIDGFAATVKDSECSIAPPNVWDRERLARSESMISEAELNVCSFGSQSNTSTLDELDKFLASFSREQSGNCDCSFAIGDELSEALGPAFRKGAIDKDFEELPPLGGDQKIEANEENVLGKAYVRQDEMVQKWGSSFVNHNLNKSVLGIHFPESKSESLLDAVVGNASNSHRSVSSNVDGSFSDKTVFSNLTSGMPVLSTSKETESKIEACNSSLCGKNLQDALHHEAVNVVYTTGVVKNAQGLQNLCVSKYSPTKAALHSWADEGQSVKSDDTRHSQSKKSEELSKAGKKRSRSGESTRPRPKDRQQIQDRVRELRDIVPNGSKCSIDALLEKTIKHMHFLKSVSLHAGQLKKNGELKDDLESGASWALDVGGQDTKYPILVKDLDQPRQMLVEMMCEERGVFLEIADIIRSLGLTILKGVMECQNDKIWAKFVVEANRDVQRVDVLVSLIQRLRLDNNSSSSSMPTASQPATVRLQRGVDSSSS